jgi:long-chain acyl-CoA synthetase
MTEQQRFEKLYSSFAPDGRLIHAFELLKRAAQLWPQRTMVICDEDSLTYKEVYLRSKILAHKLREHGVRKSERVIIYYENSVAFYVAYFAIWHAGGTVVPLNVFLNEQELFRIIQESEPKVLIVSPILLEKLTRYPHGALPEILHEIDTTSPLPKEVDPFDALEEPLVLSQDDTVAMLYTSGTTGFPKGVMLSSKNIVTNTLQGVSAFEVGKNERVFCPLPLFHSLPQNICLWTITVVGATAIIVPKIDRRSILKGIEQRPTLIVAVPALYGLFCMLKTLKFPNVKYFVAGGDALSDKIRGLFELIYGRKIANGYGLTETSPFVSVDLDDYTQPASCIGKPLPGISYKIKDSEGNSLSQGDIGVLWVTGDNIMQGYYHAPEATAQIIKDGWLNTGDLAYVTTDGKIVLVGRERELISNKGLKIYPQEVENILLTHPSVLQAAVVGLTVDGEEIPIAFIGTKESEETYEALIETVRSLCQRNLAAYKVPRQFHLQRELVVTSTGKVNKKELLTTLQSSAQKKS